MKLIVLNYLIVNLCNPVCHNYYFRMKTMNNIDAWQLENSYADLPGKFYTRISPTPVNTPKLIIYNQKLANSLGIDFSYDDDERSTYTTFFWK